MTSRAPVDIQQHVATERNSATLVGRRDVVATVTLVIGVAAFVIYVNWLQRDTWFWFDDITWLTTFHDGSLLEPAKSHLALVPGGIVYVVVHVFGLDHGYVVVRLLSVGVLAGVALAMWWHLRCRVNASVATIASLTLLWFAPNHVDVLNPTFVKHTLPLLLAIVVAGRLERVSSTWRGDTVTTLLIALAVGCSSTGLVVLAIVGTHLAGTGTRPARWWLLLSPGAAWMLWYAVAENSEDQSGIPRAITPTVRDFLSHTDNLVSDTFVDLGAGNPAVGFILGVGFVIVSLLSVLRWRTCSRTTLRWVAAAAVFIVLTSAVRNTFVLNPGEPPRYRFVLAAFVLLAVGESLRGVSIDIRFLGLAVVLLAANVLVLLDGLQFQHSLLRGAVAADAPLLLGAEAAGAGADPSREIEDFNFRLVTVGEYRDLIEDVGSPRDFLAGVQFESSSANEADRILLEESPVDVQPGTCAQSAGTPAASLTVAPGSTVSVRAIGQSAQVFVVRFGEFEIGMASLVTVDDGDSVLVSLPDDLVSIPWQVKGTSGAFLTLC